MNFLCTDNVVEVALLARTHHRIAVRVMQSSGGLFGFIPLAGGLIIGVFMIGVRVIFAALFITLFFISCCPHAVANIVDRVYITAFLIFKQ
ncbi:hypothetical protein D3C77_532390 [compost metagenome]